MDKNIKTNQFQTDKRLSAKQEADEVKQSENKIIPLKYMQRRGIKQEDSNEAMDDDEEISDLHVRDEEEKETINSSLQDIFASDFAVDPATLTEGESSTADVILIFSPTEEKELIKNTKLHLLPTGDIYLPSLMTDLKKLGYPIEGCPVSYYTKEEDIFVYCGIDPLPKTSVIPKSELKQGARITIKIRNNHVHAKGAGSTHFSQVSGAHNAIGTTSAEDAETQQMQIYGGDYTPTMGEETGG